MRVVILIFVCAIALTKADNVELNENNCPVDFSLEKLLPHEEFCNKYYQCTYGKPVAKICPLNLVFDSENEICTWPKYVNCGDLGICICEDENNGNGDCEDIGTEDTGPEEGGSDSGNGAGNGDPSQAYEICGSEGSDGTLITNECCNKFYKCFSGQPVAMFCPANLNWNIALEQCDWPENVDCGDRTICENESDGAGSENEPDTDNGNEDGGSEDTEPEEGGSDGVNGGGNGDPSQANEICGNEGSDGTLITNECCNKFYKCFNGEPVAMFCPENLNWNIALEQCDWPDNVDCGDRSICENESDGAGSENEPETDNGNGDGGCEGTGPEDGGSEGGNGGVNGDPSQANEICGNEGSDGTLITNECCNKFYKCFNGEPVTMLCPSKLNWNIALEQCDWPENVDCGNRTICENENDGAGGGTEPETDDGNGDSGCEGTGPEDGGSDGGNGGVNGDPSQANEICGNEGSDGILITNECCNKFYKCFNGEPVAMLCPSKLYWNIALEQCDWPENVDCGNRTICENETDGAGGGNEPETDNGNGDGGSGGTGPEDGGSDGGNGGVNGDPSQANEICGNEGSDGVLITNECCNKFYKCFSGEPVAMLCPSKLNWNIALEQCDWPENVDCGNRTICESDSDDNTGIDNGENAPETDTGNGGACNCRPRDAPAICAADNSEDVLVAHEKCKKFYVCSSGSPIAMDCPNNLLYNPYTEQCDWPESVECGDRTTDEDDNGDEGISEDGGSEPGGKPEGGNSDPSEASAICAAPDSDGVLVAHDTCNKFYKCFNGLPWTFDCPENLYWSTTTDRCDWKNEVDCGDRQ